MVDKGLVVIIIPRQTLLIIGLTSTNLKTGSLVTQGFDQSEQQPLGENFIKVHFGMKEVFVGFLVIDVAISYNVLLGRPWMHKNAMVPSTFHSLSSILS